MTHAYCRLSIVLLSAFLAGCAASTPRVTQTPDERCAARGHPPNSDAFKKCVIEFETASDVRMETRRRELLEKPYIPPTN